MQERCDSVVGKEAGPTSEDLAGHAKDLGVQPNSNRNPLKAFQQGGDMTRLAFCEDQPGSGLEDSWEEQEWGFLLSA